MPTVRAVAPGRVNLIGDHTDHTGGLVLPMAIDLGTSISGTRGGDVVELRSEWSDEVAVVPLDVSDPAAVEPAWARYVAGVVAELRPSQGLVGTVTTTLPVGAGLSSSAALEVALAVALGFAGAPLDLAQRCRRAEQAASGVPCGIMDQLAIASGVAGHALRIDCTSFDVAPVPIPDDVAVLVVHSGEERSLTSSAYADRAWACQAAEALIGPLREASLRDVQSIGDRTTRRRARHVVSENGRVDGLVAALQAGDRAVMAEVMAASHVSLRDDFEVSTPALDALVAELATLPGIIGARLTGAGFGGCVVALTELDAPLPEGHRAWRVAASAGAHVLD